MIDLSHRLSTIHKAELEAFVPDDKLHRPHDNGGDTVGEAVEGGVDDHLRRLLRIPEATLGVLECLAVVLFGEGFVVLYLHQSAREACTHNVVR